MYRSLTVGDADEQAALRKQSDPQPRNARAFVKEVPVGLRQHTLKYKQYVRDHSLPTIFSIGEAYNVRRELRVKSRSKNYRADGQHADNSASSSAPLKQSNSQAKGSALRLLSLEGERYFRRLEQSYEKYSAPQCKLVKKQQILLPALPAYNSEKASDYFKYPKSRAVVISSCSDSKYPSESCSPPANQTSRRLCRADSKENKLESIAAQSKIRKNSSYRDDVVCAGAAYLDPSCHGTLQIDESFFAGHVKFESNMKTIRQRYKNNRL